MGFSWPLAAACVSQVCWTWWTIRPFHSLFVFGDVCWAHRHAYTPCLSSILVHSHKTWTPDKVNLFTQTHARAQMHQASVLVCEWVVLGEGSCRYPSSCICLDRSFSAAAHRDAVSPRWWWGGVNTRVHVSSGTLHILITLISVRWRRNQRGYVCFQFLKPLLNRVCTKKHSNLIKTSGIKTSICFIYSLSDTAGSFHSWHFNRNKQCLWCVPISCDCEPCWWVQEEATPLKPF